MLILTRRVGEAIVIGDAIRVVVLGVNGSQARVGIEAPRDVTIVREELLQGRRPPSGGIGGSDDGRGT